MLRIIAYYLRCIAKADRDNGIPESIAGWCLISKRSYRNSATKRIGILLVLFSWAKAIRRLFHSVSEPAILTGGIKGYAIWDNRDDVAQIRFDHIVLNKGTPPNIFISRSSCGPETTGQAILFAFLFCLLLPYFMVWALFSRKPENIALLFDEFIEAHCLISRVRKYAITSICFYCPYENDANVMYLLLKREGVTMNKIPSPNLLSIHNTELLTDCITLTSPCQVDELSAFEKTMFYDSVVWWLPEQFYAYSEIYKSRKLAAAKSIGYYSHGSWLRIQVGSADSLLGDTEAELELVKIFGAFLSTHPDFHCTVFLHPKEKALKDVAAVTRHYDSVFGAGRYSFADPLKPGSTQFDSVDIGVGAISTILFERLFLGCKTLFYPAGMSIFPQKGSAIATICPVTADSLEQLILQSAAMSSTEFLRHNELMKYTIYSWKPESGYDQKD